MSTPAEHTAPSIQEPVQVSEPVPVSSPEPSLDVNARTDALVDLVDIPASTAPVEAPKADLSQIAKKQDLNVAGAQRVFNALEAELGDIEELKHDGFWDKIDESHIKDLPSTARRILHNFRVDREVMKRDHAKKVRELESQMTDRKSHLEKLERDFARRQAEFAAVSEDPRVQEILNMPEENLPDIYTEEGIQARIERGIAMGMRRILEPMQHAAADKARQSKYLEFINKHPEMRDASFKGEVHRLVSTRKGSGNPITTQDAYQLVKARRVLAQRQQRAQQESRARAQSARQIRAATSSGSPSTTTIPPDVRKGGAAAIAKWLQSHPEAAKKISNQLR